MTTRKLHLGFAFTMALGLVLMVVAPVAARPTSISDTAFSIQLDQKNGVVVFWNINRDDFCAWAADDFEGDPPVSAPTTLRLNETPTGAIVAMGYGTSTLELWRLDADADFSNACSDTEASTSPWAVGTAAWRYNDNDFNHDASVIEYGLHRTDAFGERGTGSVWDAAGNRWHYSWNTRVVYDKNLSFRFLHFQSTLSKG